MTDIAGLGLSVDSSQVLRASQNLDQFRGSAEGAGRAGAQYVLALQQSQAATQSFRESAQALSKDLGGMNTALDQMMAKLADSRQYLKGSSDALKEFGDLRGQVENVGRAFGVTSTAMEAYYRASQNLGFTTPQTVNSLQSITQAMENQTAAGQNARRVMTDLGVAFLDSAGKAKDADKLLQQFTERMRMYADSAQKYRTVSMVLGPMDMDSYGKINDPDYVTIDEKRRQAVQAQYTTNIADRTRNAQLLSKQTDRNDTEYADLSSKYDLSRGILFGTTSADRQAIRAKVGLSSDEGIDGGSQSDRLAMMRYLAKNPDTQEAVRARGLSGTVSDKIGSSALGREWKFLGSGEFSANATEIEARYRDDRQRLGLFPALGNQFINAGANLFNSYKPLANPVDARQEDPIEKYLKDANTAASLANVGDLGLTRRQQADNLLQRDLKTGKGGKAEGDPATLLMQRFQGAYGRPYGQDEGEAVFKQIQSRITRQRDTAMTPGQGMMDENAVQQYMLQTRPEDRGAAEDYMRFLGQTPGGDPSRVAAGGASIGDLMMPGFEAPGALTPGQQGAFFRYRQGKLANDRGAATETFDRGLTQQRAQTRTASEGPAALEELTTKQQALNAALAARKEPNDVLLAQERALEGLYEKRRTQAEDRIAQMQVENRLAQDQLALRQNASSDPASQAQAQAQGTIDAQYERTKRSNPALAEKERVEAYKALGIAAESSGQQILTGSQQELKQQTDLLGVSNQRLDQQAKFASDQKVELEFAKSIGDAWASGDAARIAAIEAQIAKTKQLRSEVAAVVQEARNFKLASELRQGNDYDEAGLNLSPQERRQRRLLRDSNIENGRVDGPTGYGQPAMTSGAAAMNFESGGAPVSSGNFGGTPDSVQARKKMAFEYFLSRGDTPQVAAGRLANLLQENGNLDPTKPGDYVNGSPTAIGIQQLHPDRQASFAGMMGVAPGQATLAQQLQYAYDDPDSIYQRNKGKLQGASAYTAAGVISRFQERPGNGDDEVVNRGRKAEGLLQEMMAGRPGWQARNSETLRSDDVQSRGQVADSQSVFGAQQATQDARRGLVSQNQPGNAARLATVDPTQNPLVAQNAADQQTAGVIAGQRDQAAATIATTRQQIEEQRKLIAATNDGRAAAAEATRQAKLDDEERQLGSGILDRSVRNQQLLAQAVNAVGSTMAQDRQKTLDNIEDTQKMADAYKLGADAAALMRQRLDLAPIEREIEALQKQGVAVGGLAAKYQGLAADKARAASVSQGSAIQARNQGDRDRNALTEAGNDPFASDQTIARRQSELRIDQELKSSYQSASQADKDQFVTQQRANQTLKETTAQTQLYREAWTQAGEATMSALNNIIVNGGKAKDVLGALAKELSSLLLKMAEKPLINSGGDFLSNLLGFGKSAASASGAFAGANTAGMGVSAGVGGLYAAGGVINGGLRMMAGGGVLDRPTAFYAAGGQPSVAGEVGSEAIMPIRRMPNGDMGVVASGGGGGRGIVVNAPITINGGGGGGAGGGMDQAAMAAMGAQLKETVRQAVVAGIADEKRAGGSLY